ncbi:MAG TPA: S41 family peptidase [Candidatus Udaeobacter sp.]|jgi:C-terminal processing protease CtpA/Prc|nr:S41 family peptidase [Candidatus Udaeobacter sp.]
MRHAVVVLMTAAVVAVSCSTSGPISSTGSPSKTIDIKRSKLDLAYSGFVDDDVHHVTSKKALEAAFAGVKAAVRSAGGKDDVAIPEFQDVDQPQTTDFTKFAAAVSELAGRAQLSSDRIADAAIVGMMSASPDCHTFYVTAAGNVAHSLEFIPKGTDAIVPTQGTSLGGPDEAGLTGKMLPGGIAYITFHAWVNNGTYHLNDTFRAILEKARAAGAKAWLIDLRGNLGGFPVDLSSLFLNGEATQVQTVKTGNAGTKTANKDLRLPEAFQLPMVIVANDRTASGSEHFIIDLREGKRATVVGQKTTGCAGTADEFQMPGGGLMSVVVGEIVGAATGFHYNNVGVPPDVQADDATAVAKAIEILQQKIAGG